MQIFDPYITGQVFPEGFRVIDDILRLQHLARLHHRTDDIGLPSLLYLFFYKTVGIFAVIPAHDTILNRLSVGGKLVYNGNI